MFKIKPIAIMTKADSKLVTLSPPQLINHKKNTFIANIITRTTSSTNKVVNT